MKQLEKAINKIIGSYLGMNTNESLLILIDKYNRELGQHILNIVLAGKIDAALLEIELEEKNVEPSDTIHNVAKQVSAALVVTRRSLLHSKFKNVICHNGGRILFILSPSIEAFVRTAKINLENVESNSRRIADLFSISKDVHLTTEAGTDLSFRTARHKGTVHSPKAIEPGSFTYLPAGEASITPDRGSMNGVAIIDGSIPQVGLMENPIEILIKNGFAYKLKGNEEAIKLRKILKAFGKLGRNIAEFGIGTNPLATLTGLSVEDEKVAGTAHLAMGNPNFEGGCLTESLHLDLILQKPNVVMDGRLLIKNGKIVF